MSPIQEGPGHSGPPFPRDSGSWRTTGTYPASGAEHRLESLELRLLLEAIADRYGYDFRDYDEPFLREKVRGLLAVEQLPTVTALMDKLLRDSRAMDRLVTAVSLDPVPLFDNPAAYATLRSHALPQLREHFFVRAWQVGCTTGERAYSLSILFKEEGLEDKSRIYVTDMNGVALRKAKQGLFPLTVIRSRRAAYAESGGRGTLEDHYSETFDSALISPALRKNLVFAQHNLGTDASFNEFHLIVCVGVLARFNASLQARVLSLLDASLAQGGYLLLSPGETPRVATRAREYAPVDEGLGLFQRLS